MITLHNRSTGEVICQSDNMYDITVAFCERVDTPYFRNEFASLVGTDYHRTAGFTIQAGNRYEVTYSPDKAA